MYIVLTRGRPPVCPRDRLRRLRDRPHPRLGRLPQAPVQPRRDRCLRRGHGGAGPAAAADAGRDRLCGLDRLCRSRAARDRPGRLPGAHQRRPAGGSGHHHRRCGPAGDGGAGMSPEKLRGWVYLSLTVMFEVVATLCLRASNGFTVLVPSVVAIAAYAATVVVLSRALQTITMGLAYVVWTAAGTAGVVVLSILLFGDRMTALAWTGIVLVLIGVATVHAFPAERRTRTAVHRMDERSATDE